MQKVNLGCAKVENMDRYQLSAPLKIFVGIVLLIVIAGCNTRNPTTATPLPTASLLPFGEIISDNVPTRNGPGDDYGRVGDFNRGDIVKLILTDGQWIKVRSEQFDEEVWVYARFVHQIAFRPAATMMPTSTPKPTLPPLPSPTATSKPTATQQPTSTMTATLPPLPTMTPTPPPTMSPTLPPLPTMTRTPSPTQTRQP